MRSANSWRSPRKRKNWPIAWPRPPDDAQRQRLGRRFDHLQQELQRRDAYHLDHKIERVLVGLGFGPASFQQDVTQLSGGQQNRLLLAKLLLQDPDILLLDEPSNHLDLQATRWLEDYLVDTSQTLLVVSHDRYFLDKVTNRTLELYQGTVDQYAGNFSAYQRQKAERLEVQRRTFAQAADRNREDGRLRAPAPLRPEAHAGGRPPEETGTDRTRRGAPRNHGSTDVLSRPPRARAMWCCGSST